jgi:hypothetical protein
VQARAGKKAEALQTAKLAGETGYRDNRRALADLVEGLAESGHVDEAVRTARLLNRPQEPLILGFAAISLSRRGYSAAALQIAGTIADYPMRVATFAGIARALRQAGADGDAATAIRSLMSAAVAASNDYETIGGLVALARGLPD